MKGAQAQAQQQQYVPTQEELLSMETQLERGDLVALSLDTMATLLMRQEQGETVPWVGVATILEIFSDYYRG